MATTTQKPESIIMIGVGQKIKRISTGTVLEVYGLNSRNKTYFCKVVSAIAGNVSGEKVGDKQNVGFKSIAKFFSYEN